MAKDLVVKLSVDGKQYEIAIENAKKKLNELKQANDKTNKSGVTGFNNLIEAGKKIAPVVAGVAGAMAGFNEVCKASKTMTDNLGIALKGTTSVVDSFFYSISTGNFDGFLSGLSSVIKSAREAYTALENLKVANVLNTPAIESAEAEMKHWRSIMEDTTRTYEERVKAKEMSLKAGEGLTEIFKAQEAKALDAFNKNLDNLVSSKTKGVINRELAKSILQSSLTYDSNKLWVSAYEWSTREQAQKHANQYSSDQERQWAYNAKEKQLLNNEEYKVRKAISELTVEQLQTFKDLADEFNTFSMMYVGVMDDINTIRDSNLETASGGKDREAFSINERKGLRYLTEVTPSQPTADMPIRLSVSEEESKANIEHTIYGLKDKISKLQVQLEFAEPTDLQAFRDEISKAEIQLQALETPIEELNKQISDLTLSSIAEVGNMVNSFASFGDVLKSDTSAMEKLGAGINFMIGILQTMQTLTDMATASTALNTVVTQANAQAKTGEAIAGATASGAKMAFPYNLIAIATGVAAVMSALTSMGKFANGGIVGGNSIGGDGMMVRVNSGEMILNTSQQRNLFNLLNTNGIGGGSTFNNVEFKIQGRDLVGTINTYNRYNNKLK